MKFSSNKAAKAESGDIRAVPEPFVVTLNELPGHVITEVHGLVSSVAASAGRTAVNKGSGSLSEALEQLRSTAWDKGANAIVGMRIANFGASQGGMLGDAVGVTLIGTAVTVEIAE